MADYYSSLPRMKQELAFQKKANVVLNKTRWLEPETIKSEYGSTKLEGDKIILGAIGETAITVKDNMHLMTIAGTRSGKTVNLKNNLFFHKSSVLAIDVKSELARDTALIRHEDLGQDIFIIDPEELVTNDARQFRAYYNPLEKLTLENPNTSDFVSKIAGALVVPNPDAKQPFWDDSARTLIRGLMLHVCSSEKYEGKRDLVSVYRLLTLGLPYKGQNEAGEEVDLVGLTGVFEEMKENADQLKARLKANNDNMVILDNCEDIAFQLYTVVMNYQTRGPNEKGSVYSTACEHLSFIGSRQMQSILRAGRYDRTFNIADLKEKPNGISVYLCLPPSKLKICSGWLRMFIMLSVAEMEHAKAEVKPAGWKQGDPETATGLQTLFILDEFATAIGRLEILKDAAGLVAGPPYDMRLWCIIQDLKQIETLYRDAYHTFLGNCSHISLFCNTDLPTLQYISQKLGKMLSPKASLDKDGNKSLQLQEHDLLSPQEAAIEFGRKSDFNGILVMAAGERPWALQKASFWDKKSPIYETLFRSYHERVERQNQQ